jgi:hypothetical protein
VTRLIRRFRSIRRTWEDGTMSSGLLRALRLRSPLWRHGDFLKLWSAQTLSQFTGQVGSLAIPLVAITVLEVSAFQVGLLVALLVSPPDGIGPSRLLIVDAAGGARSVDLDRIRSGWSACAGRRAGGGVRPGTGARVRRRPGRARGRG